MKVFKVYQLKGSENRDIRFDVSYGKYKEATAIQAFSNNAYTHVSNITAPDLNGVFQVGNIGPEEYIERLDRMASVSCGDIIVDEDKHVYLVAPFGFTHLGEEDIMLMELV